MIRHLPYAVGAFMLIPLALWGGLQLAIPGAASGFDDPVMVSLFALSLPLVAWFYLRNLGGMANSMAGESEFARPRNRAVRRMLGLLPGVSLGIGIAVLALFSRTDPATGTLAAVAAVALLVPFVIWRGERSGRRQAKRLADTAPAPTVDETAAATGVDDDVAGEQWAVGLCNLVLLVAIGSWAWGPAVALYAALAGVPTAFGLLLLVAWRGTRRVG